jgi:PAS domain S-box-containing protein
MPTRRACDAGARDLFRNGLIFDSVGDLVTAEQLSQVLERLSDGIILVDRGGFCLYLNPEAVRLLDKPKAEVVGRHLREAMPDAVEKVVEGARDRLLAGEEVLLLRAYFAQGRWFEVLGRPTAEIFLIHFHDITERLQAESARRQSEARFRLLVNGVTDYALIMLDPKGEISSWNAGAERMWGYTAGEVRGKTLAILLPPELAERGVPERRLEEVVRRGSATAERWVVRKNGSRFLAHGTYTALQDEAKYPSGFALVVKDITEQRALEKSLSTSAERLRLAVEAGAIGTWEEILGEERFITNRQFLVLSGLPFDEEPTVEAVLSAVHPDDRDYVRRNREQVLAGEVGDEFEWEYRVPRPTGGRTRWVEVHGRLFRSEAEPGRVMGVLRDTSKRHDMDEFRELAAGLIAHDLRSPLASIRLTSQMLLQREALSENATQQLHSVIRKVDRMVNMVARLLVYTQAQFGGGLPLDKGFTDLEQVCRDALGDIQAERRGCKIRFAAEGDCRGLWDRTRLTEVVTNLITNALQHGQRECEVDVVTRDEGDRVALEVHNFGPPIRGDLIPAIFEPFHRAGRPRRSGEVSFGLGLYIVREIVAAHGGTIDVSSSVEAGTTFTVRLPRGSAPTLHPH